MHRLIHKISFAGIIFAAILLSGSSVLALSTNANAHAIANSSNSTTPSSTNNQSGNAHLAAAQLKSCQNRQAAINNILSRIDTRSQNQLTLFSTIASRVEAFYVKQGKSLANYNELVAAVNTAANQAKNDFGTMSANSSFNCSVSSPKAMVTSFQADLKTEISDLQNYRTAVKNLIVGVASANQVKLTSSSQPTSEGSN